MSEEPTTLFILYGSATGNAEHIAKDLAAKQQPSSGFHQVLCFELDQFKRKCQPIWEKETSTKYGVLIVTSTTGNGDAPENASRFVRYIKRNQTVDEKPFRNVAYAVLGLGDTNYDQFCQCAKVIDKKMLDLGGTRIRPLKCADEATGLEEAVEPWTETILDAIAAACRGSLNKNEIVVNETKEEEEEKIIEENGDSPTVVLAENGAKVSDGVATVRALLGLQDNDDKAKPIWIPDPAFLPSLTASRSCELFVPSGEEATDFNCSESFTTTSSSGLHYTMKHPFESMPLKARYLTETPTKPAEEAMILLQSTEMGRYSDESLQKALNVFESHFSLSPDDETCTSAQRDRNGKRVLELSLALPDDYTLEYAPGDSLGLLVENTPDSVQFVLNMLQTNHGIRADQQVSIDEGRAVTVEEVVRQQFDLSSPIKNKRILFGLSQFATNEEEKVALQFLSSKTPEGDKIFQLFVDEQRLNVVDLLREFPSTQGISMQGLFGMLTALPPRYYSVCSSPLDNATSVTIAFSVVDYVTPSLKVSGRERGMRRIGGVATRYLETVCSPLLCSSNDCTNGIQLKIFPKPTAEFRMPNSLSTPLILIGPGTGIAPFMGFLAHRRALSQSSEHHATAAAQTVVEGMWRGGYDVLEKDLSIHNKHDLLDSHSGERDTDRNSVGSVDLFFGCRHADHDWLYRNEMEQWLGETTITMLHTAFSRDGPNRIYVQNKLMEHAERIRNLILEQNASIYVCGDGNVMARDVKDAIVKLLSQSMGEEDAVTYFETMKKRNRFLLDIWS